MTRHRSIASLLAVTAALLVTNLIVQGSRPAEAGGAAGLDPCPPDLDGDGVVAVPDLLTMLAAWGPCPSGARVMSMSKTNLNGPLMLIRLWSDNRLQVYMATTGNSCFECDESFPQPLTWTDIESPPVPAGVVPSEVVWLEDGGRIYVAHSDGTVYLASMNNAVTQTGGTNCSQGTTYCVMELGEWDLVP